MRTSVLNRWFESIARHHPPPAVRKTAVVRGPGRDKGEATKTVPLKVKYMSQIRSRPPTFAIYANRSEIPDTYLRCAARRRTRTRGGV